VNKTYDVGIIGAGVAGAFAALRAAENFKDSKVILFDLGRPPGKRRRQLEGWLGCFPTGDGKIHVDNVLDVMTVVDGRKARPVDKWVHSKLEEAGPMKIIKDKLPQVAVQRKATSMGFDIYKNDYIQWKPESVHKLSKIMSERIIDNGNVDFSFDNEVFQILKKDNAFELTTHQGDFKCKNVIIAVGRSGWRWANEIYHSFGIIDSDDYAHVGIRIECASQYMKEFNKSHCSFFREDLEIGPLCWDGTVIPEDHADLVVSAFRSNEERWKKMGKDKVSFDIIGRRYFPGEGIKQMERLAKLGFLMFNDRVGREKIKKIIKKESSLSQIPEYDWLIGVIEELEELFPSLINRGYYHCPTIQAQTAPILLGPDLGTDVENLYVCGESAGFIGIGAAAISGVIALDSALK
jgi:uncharacterized FAD-dependent dehydrogenase